MTKPVNPKVKGRVIMKVSMTASGWTLPSGRLTARDDGQQAQPGYCCVFRYSLRFRAGHDSHLFSG